MNNYYFFCWKNATQVASAFAPKGTRLAHELIADIEEIDELPFELELVKLTEKKTGLIKDNDLAGLDSIWLDYQPNSLAWPLMSDRLKLLVSDNLTGKEGIGWITAKVNGNGEYRNYYIPRFEKMLNVLDEQKTIYVKGTDRIIKPCFSLAKISSFSVFHKPSAHNLWKITSGLYISEKIKKAIQKEKLTGMNFEKITI
jgi:hypothetical protein